jgi:hypothetical protein
MKKIYLIALLTLSLINTACIDQQTTTSSGSNAGGDPSTQSTGGDGTGGTTGNGGTDGGSTDGGGGYTGTGATCYGTSADGQGPGTPIHHMNLFLAGFQDWYPQVNSDPLASTFITPQEASILFSSDSRLRVRFMAKTQPIPPSNQTYCYGRNTGAGIPPYGKLKFEIWLRDITCSTGSTTSCASGNYQLGPRYGGPIFVGPIDVNNCSDVIDLGHLRNQSAFGTTIEVAAVKSDQTCNANGTFCPAEKNVRSQDCWQMTLQVVTDSTQDFN